MKIKDNKVQIFLDELASASPTPGGGSAAALAGAMGAALVSMVCSLTVGRKRFADVEDELQEVLSEAKALQRQLTDLAEADSQAFEQVMAAYRLPKETEEERTARQAAIQTALRQATRIPMETAAACAAVVRLADRIVPKINPNALSDLGAAALLAEAGLRGAQLNVVINLADIRDSEFAQAQRNKLGKILDGVDQKKEQVFSYVLNHLSG